jgi:hypothetical protein
MTDPSQPLPHPLKARLGGRNLYLVGMMGSGKKQQWPPHGREHGLWLRECRHP